MELDTGFLLMLLVRLNGVEVVRLVVVELGAAEEVAEELGLLESSLWPVLSLFVEFCPSDEFVGLGPDCEACCDFEILGMVYLMFGVDEPRPKILAASVLVDGLEPGVDVVEDESIGVEEEVEADDEEAVAGLVLVTVNLRLPKLLCFIANWSAGVRDLVLDPSGLPFEDSIFLAIESIELSVV